MRLKPLSIAVLAFLLAGFPLGTRAEEKVLNDQGTSDQVTSDHWSYSEMRDLIKKGVIDRPFPSDGAPVSRVQMAVLSAQALQAINGAQYAAAGPPDLALPPGLPDMGAGSASAGNADKDSVYRLVQEYHDELVKLGAKSKDITDQLVALKTGQTNLSTQLERVLSSTGVKLNGDATVHTSNILLYYPTFPGGQAKRVAPTVAYFDFKISARPRKDLYAEVVYRMEKVFGGFWGALDIAGVRRFYMSGQTPIGFEFGTVNSKNTPLTLWAPQDEYPYEMEVLARKRREGMAEQYIGDNSFPLNGGRLNGTLVFFKSLDMELEAMGFRTAIAGTKPSAQAFTKTMPYDQYLVGGTMHLTGDSSKTVRGGLNYFELMESVDTDTTSSSIPPQRNNVVSADLGLNFLSGAITLSEEYATSNYTPNYGRQAFKAENGGWTTGVARLTQFGLNFPAATVKIHELSVDEGFINYAAQTRTEDRGRSFGAGIPISDNTFDPHRGAYGLSIGDTTIQNLFGSHYNNIIFATSQGPAGGQVLDSKGQQRTGIYLTHGFMDESLPEGLATPNRNGFGGSMSFKLVKGGFLQPSVLGGHYNEWVVSSAVPVNTDIRTYAKAGGGLKLDFSAFGLPLDFSAGVTSEDTRSNSFVAFTSTQFDYNLHWEFLKGIHLLGGFKHVDWNGSNFIDQGSGPGVWSYHNLLSDIYGAGLDWWLSKNTNFYLTYAFHNVEFPRNDLTGDVNFSLQEWEGKMIMRF